MADEEIYQKFIDYMNNPVFEFTESEFKMPMITSFITPEEEKCQLQKKRLKKTCARNSQRRMHEI